MVRHQTLRFLFVCGLITILLLSGLGVEDQEHSFREDSIFFLVNFFSGEGVGGGASNKKSSDKNKEIQAICSNIFAIISAVQIIPHFLKEKKCLICVFQIAELCAMFWARIEIWH
jgi:hypothetical protein